MSSKEDKVFFYNYSIVLGLLAVMIILFLVIALYLGTDDDAVALKQATKVSANTVPVGVVRLVDEEAEAVRVATVTRVATVEEEEAGDMGKRVYNGLCITCHSGLPNIPKVGDVTAWESRIAQGMALLYEHAIRGFISEGGLIAMPPKGGNMNLTDEEVKAAVDYMVANSQ